MMIKKLHCFIFALLLSCGGSQPSLREELNAYEEERGIEPTQEKNETPSSGGGLLGTTSPEETKISEETVPIEAPQTEPAIPKAEAESKNVIPEIHEESQEVESVSKYSGDAMAALKNGDLNAAKIKLEEATNNSDENSVEAYYNLALIAYLNRDYITAKKNLEKCLTQKITSQKVPLLLAKVYTLEGRAGEAEQVLKDLADKNEQNVDLRNAYLRYLIETKRAHEALDLASNLLKKEETNIEVIKTIGMAYIAMKKFDLAEFVLSNALQIKKDAEIYNLLGQIYINKDDKKKAIAHLLSAVETDPTLADAHNNLGVLYEEAGDYAGAISEFKLALKYFPTFAEATLNLGNSYRKNLEFGLARQTYLDALKLNKDMAEAYFNLGILYIEEKGGEDKEQRYNQAIQYLNTYKEMKKNVLDKNDPVDKYIQEAKRLLEAAIEEKKQGKETMQPQEK